MSLSKVFLLILAGAFVATSRGYGQQLDNQVQTIAGTVTYVDVAAQVVGIKTKKGLMAFQIAAESDLLRFAHHITSIEIEKGDPVIIQYESLPFGKNDIIRLVDKNPGDSNHPLNFFKK